MKIEIPGLDVQKGLELYDDDEELYFIILRSYVKNTPGVLDNLRDVTSETLSDYAITIHGVKGTSTNIGAEDLRKAALELELLAKAGDLAGVQAVNEAFIKQGETLIAEIQSWLKNNVPD